MRFVYTFDLMGFDGEGKVKECNGVSLPQAQANYLYLVSKFNQNFLNEKGLSVPAFFKEEQASVLRELEQGGDFNVAKEKVFGACLPQVAAMEECAEKEVVSALVERTSVADLEFADRFKNAKNTLELEYIMTTTSGNIYNKVEALRGQEMTKKNKSNLFKEVIKYNALVCATDRVREGQRMETRSANMAG